ncbi:MAG: hypothetical protein ACLP8Y_06570 [Thermoplasmata archaeon]
MRGMGPEALLIQARVDPRVVLAEYALHDCTREEVRAVEEMLRRELECLPVRHTAVQRLVRWGRKRLRRVDLPLAAAPALCREPEKAPHAPGAAARGLAGATLAALPALRAAVHPAGAGPMVAAAPAYARD